MKKHIDLTELNKVAEGDQEFVRETITILVEEIPVNIESINEFARTEDIDSLKKIIHKMKSSFMLIGMIELWPIVETIEKSDSKEVILPQIPAYIQICTEAVQELLNIQNSGN